MSLGRCGFQAAINMEGDLPLQHIGGFDFLLVSVQRDGLSKLRCLFYQAKLTVGGFAGAQEMGAGLAHPAHFARDGAGEVNT
ncbi:MAG: hypothetical protein ACK4F5_08945 [Aliihoeflea sp.]